ncbi:DUF3060 domain-containing protein [Brucellaceae bacterium C25G]
MLKFLLISTALSTSIIGFNAQAKDIIINGIDLKDQLVCTDNDIKVYGKNNTIVITGNCDEIDVRGNGHNITFEKSKEVEIKGANNKVTGGTTKELSIKGKRNQVNLVLNSSRNKAELDISGFSNITNITLETKAEFEIRGRKNKVTWSKNSGTPNPKIFNSGNKNTIKMK